MGSYKEDSIISSQEASTEGQDTSASCKLQLQKIPLNIRKKSLTMREAELWKILLGFQNSTGQSPEQQILTVKLALLLSSSWTGFSRGSFQFELFSKPLQNSFMGHELRCGTDSREAVEQQSLQAVSVPSTDAVKGI